jgi:glutathione S-transferase
MYGSPWSERVRWAFAFKRFPYEKQNYQPGVDEEQLKKLTGQAQVPVLLTDNQVIPDSIAILDWLEAAKPEPALVPRSEDDRVQVMLWEELMDECLGPQGRTLIVGRQLLSRDPEIQRAGQFFAAKYGHSPSAEEHARLKVKRILQSLKHTLSGHEYLVGNAFTRADLTTASMLMLLKPAPDEFFFLPEPWRSMYAEPLAEDKAWSSIFAWRDQMYKRHRGEAVKP